MLTARCSPQTPRTCEEPHIRLPPFADLCLLECVGITRPSSPPTHSLETLFAPKQTLRVHLCILLTRPSQGVATLRIGKRLSSRLGRLHRRRKRVVSLDCGWVLLTLAQPLPPGGSPLAPEPPIQIAPFQQVWTAQVPTRSARNCFLPPPSLLTFKHKSQVLRAAPASRI